MTNTTHTDSVEMESIMQPILELGTECCRLVNEKTAFVFVDENHRLNREYQADRLRRLVPLREDAYKTDAKVRSYYTELKNGLRVTTYSLRATFENFDEKTQAFKEKLEASKAKINEA